MGSSRLTEEKTDAPARAADIRDNLSDDGMIMGDIGRAYRLAKAGRTDEAKAVYTDKNMNTWVAGREIFYNALDGFIAGGHLLTAYESFKQRKQEKKWDELETTGCLESMAYTFVNANDVKGAERFLEIMKNDSEVDPENVTCMTGLLARYFYEKGNEKAAWDFFEKAQTGESRAAVLSIMISPFKPAQFEAFRQKIRTTRPALTELVVRIQEDAAEDEDLSGVAVCSNEPYIRTILVAQHREALFTPKPALPSALPPENTVAVHVVQQPVVKPGGRTGTS